ncbi:MAG: DegT/DnrJ/EryC1/StrS family aminotransferase [Thalassolituus oleivorans]|uniref:DegT/DnrJ/EryC1/StrS family aminotransferase n=1 Tax=Thalassolituus oleivorans TaxID=187493 RepID=UPI001B66CCD5|nr:DegT/DnrJ/EryC1/StrS family aminotransferase [Thalassolituus oleivorans]MBQ0725759.1 DegT/DnrJ/EryC1/StrS family aminotransferase [Thalassolituus oleivorans]
MIPVTKPYLPSRERLDAYIDGIYERRWLTNNGPLMRQLTQRLEEYLGVENLLLVSNGTLALQIAYKALGISDENNALCPEAITTPFTFVATSSSLQWEGVKPVFADIDKHSWCLAPENIEAEITHNTRAIVPVHVFGNACDVEAIDKIARKHDFKVVYDASHAFGVDYNGESLLRWGDAATLSFHATKLFHTIEGGAIIFKRRDDFERAEKLISFGLVGPETIDGPGINAKMNEFQAAMGLCVLDEIHDNLKARKNIVEQYRSQLPSSIVQQQLHTEITTNYAYMPVVLNSEKQVIQLLDQLQKQGISARRYFSPSLNNAGFGNGTLMPISQDIASRILCLPLYVDLSVAELGNITKIVGEVVTL